jgi:hypothetical protein
MQLLPKLEGRLLGLERREAAIATSLDLAGCYVVTTDVLPGWNFAHHTPPSQLSRSWRLPQPWYCNHQRQD